MEIPEQYTNERNARPINYREKDETGCQRMEEIREIWAEELLVNERKGLLPRIMHVADQGWEGWVGALTSPIGIQRVRRNADLSKITNARPEIESWVIR